MKELWDKNKDKLRTELSSRDDLNECSYVDLVKIAFDKIYNDDSRLDNENLFIDRVHEIDDGDYQGTLIYLIPPAGPGRLSHDFCVVWVLFWM